jgi:hypothetical protein
MVLIETICANEFAPTKNTLFNRHLNDKTDLTDLNKYDS